MCPEYGTGRKRALHIKQFHQLKYSNLADCNCEQKLHIHRVHFDQNSNLCESLRENFNFYVLFDLYLIWRAIEE